MSWIKVGAYFLNLDNITSVEINEHTPGRDREITVFYTTGLSEYGRANDIFSGKQADAILRYLESIAIDVES
ncbi:MAG TPA: hypothetical protein VGD69_08215 [Herpetosiphonaceae bacterium]